MSNTVELKYPVSIIENGEKKEIKFLQAGRIKVKHIELLPASLLEKSEGKELNISAKEMIPLFKELIPFMAGIFNLSIDAIKDIDFADIENVVEILEEVFPKDEKKN
jgi:hypothetical protein